MTQFTYLAVFSDTHIVEPHETVRGIDTLVGTQQLISHIKSEPLPLAGVVCLGDLCDTALTPNRRAAIGSPASYEHARALFSEIPLPLYSLPGNHDHPELMSEYFPQRWTTVKDGIRLVNVAGFDLIGIDARTGPEAIGRVSPETIRALDEALARSQRAILLSHYPLVDLDSPKIDRGLSTVNRDELLPLLSRHKERIAACFHGHLHLWITKVLHGLVSYGAPAVSFTFLLEPQSAENETIVPTPRGYLLVGLGSDGSVIVRPRFLS
jgi:3',5'-cyclic AMP phosphodiesterase CpdA